MGLSLQMVNKTVGGEIHLKDINLEFESGSRNVILGHTQAGKTTLLRVMAGLDRPSSGKILVDGPPDELKASFAPATGSDEGALRRLLAAFADPERQPVARRIREGQHAAADMEPDSGEARAAHRRVTSIACEM